MSDEERRKNDEAFKFKIIESQAEIKTLIHSQSIRVDGLSGEHAKNAIAIANLQYALWGGPKESDIGLLEKHRRLNRNWTIFMAIVVFIANAFGYLAKAYVSKWLTAPVYTSPAKAYLQEKNTQKIRHIHIRYTQPKEKAEDSMEVQNEKSKSEGKEEIKP